MSQYDVIIVGGGLAGLTAAIHLSQRDIDVLLIEQKEFPHHKVCGEYVSNEVLPYLEFLNIPIAESGAVTIDRLKISTKKGKYVETDLPLGGFGISRYALDHLLYQKALENEVSFVFESVRLIQKVKESFQVDIVGDGVYNAGVVVGAYGKRSSLDKYLNRDFIKQKSSWLGVKSHYRYEGFPSNEVALHNFNGGYGGLSKTETGAINFCYLTSYASFQKTKNISDFNTQIVSQNPFLKEFLSNASPIFTTPLTIGQISFQPKSIVENHILMCGDAAGLIHPLCGNGMAMAIHAAKILSESILRFFENKTYSREQLEVDYQAAWKTAFERRMWVGRKLQSILLNEKWSSYSQKAAISSPFLLRSVVKATHGKPIIC